MLKLKVSALALATVFAVAAVLPSSAQSSRLKPFPVGSNKTKTVNVSVSYQFFLEGETKSIADQAELADQGRRHLYKLLAKECDVLLETIAAECAMNRANVNTQLRKGSGHNRREGVRVSGSATYNVQLKSQGTNE